MGHKHSEESTPSYKSSNFKGNKRMLCFSRGTISSAKIWFLKYSVERSWRRVTVSDVEEVKSVCVWVSLGEENRNLLKLCECG